MPAHNEGPRIYENIKRVTQLARNGLLTHWKDVVSSFEIIVIDDGSTDNTWQEIKKAELEFFEARGIHLEKNAGKGLALRHGYNECKGTLIFFIDSDLDIAPEYMFDLTKVLFERNVDAVLGSEQLHQTKSSYPRYRRFVSASYTFLSIC